MKFNDDDNDDDDDKKPWHSDLINVGCSKALTRKHKEASDSYKQQLNFDRIWQKQNIAFYLNELKQLDLKNIMK